MASFSTGNYSTLKGVAFPFGGDDFSLPAKNEGLSTVVDAVKSLLFTGVGELPMEPAIGTNLHSFVFETMNSLTLAQISAEVRRVVSKWEPRMNILSVTATEDADIGIRSGIVVHIEYAMSGSETGHIDLPIGT